MILLDSTVLVDVLRDRRNRRALLQQLVSRGDQLATCTVNVAEVYGGMRPGEEEMTESLLGGMVIYPLTETLARSAGSLKYSWARKGKTLEIPDMVIAATAMQYGLTLMTDNRKDFPMSEIRFVEFL